MQTRKGLNPRTKMCHRRSLYHVGIVLNNYTRTARARVCVYVCGVCVCVRMWGENVFQRTKYNFLFLRLGKVLRGIQCGVMKHKDKNKGKIKITSVRRS